MFNDEFLKDKIELSKYNSETIKLIKKYFLIKKKNYNGRMSDEEFISLVNEKKEQFYIERSFINHLGINEIEYKIEDVMRLSGFNFEDGEFCYSGHCTNISEDIYMYILDDKLCIYKFSYNVFNDSYKEEYHEFLIKDITDIFVEHCSTLKYTLFKKVYVKTNLGFVKLNIAVPGSKFTGYVSLITSDKCDIIIENLRKKVKQIQKVPVSLHNN